MDRFPLRSYLAVVTLLALTSPAGATALPDPPFSGGGFVAPSSDVLRQEEKVVGLLARYVKNRATCDWIAVTELQLAYTPANPTKIDSSQAKWSTCVQKVDAYFDKGRDRLLERGLPACLDAAAIDALRTASTGLLASVSSAVYCDGDGAAPDPVVGLDIPDKKQETIGETSVAKILVKVWHNTGKCYSKAAKLALRTGGVLSSRDLEKIQACFDRVTDYAQDKIADLEQQQKLPACLSTATAEAAAGAVASFAGSTTGDVYCQE
ncbi:MAG: hypothetical protein AB1689_17365 [Thermodesulfobacteriota bacterium]